MGELKVLFVLFLRWPKFFGTLLLISVVGMLVEGVMHSGPGGQVPGSVVSADYPFQSRCSPVITQGYGPVNNDREPIINGVRFHTGIDLACPEGTDVFSTTNGVAHVTLGYGGGYGNNVAVEFVSRTGLDTADHHYFIRYAHLDSVVVSNGSLVSAGQLIGKEGSTGNSSGPHLHFEVDRDILDGNHSIDPSPFLAKG